MEWSDHSWQLCWCHWKQLAHAFLSHSIFTNQLIILPLKSALPFVQLSAGTYRPTWSKTVHCKHDKTCRKNNSSHWKGLLTWSKNIPQNCTFSCINFCIKDILTSVSITCLSENQWAGLLLLFFFSFYNKKYRYKRTKMSHYFC